MGLLGWAFWDGVCVMLIGMRVRLKPLTNIGTPGDYIGLFIF